MKIQYLFLEKRIYEQKFNLPDKISTSEQMLKDIESVSLKYSKFDVSEEDIKALARKRFSFLNYKTPHEMININ